jgi:hypothetical protein
LSLVRHLIVGNVASRLPMLFLYRHRVVSRVSEERGEISTTEFPAKYKLSRL